MTLNNGLGDVVSGSKNILVRDDVGEMLTGTFHTNGRDIWILMAKRNGNNFYAYLLTGQGISTNPITSSQIGQNTSSGLGPMKFSADGNMIAATMLGSWPWSIVLANFNRTTGALTNGRDIWLSYVVNNQPHSFEFSPDNSKLYVNLWQPLEIWQYNLSAGNINAISASKTVVSPYQGPTFYGQMARANNGKIYLTSLFSSKLDYIANPNAAGLACNYTPGTINAYISGLISLSIPNMIQGLGQPYIPSIAGKTNICIGEQVTYNVPYLTNDQSVTWQYTGTGNFVSNGSSGTLTNATGAGLLIATITGNCGITRDTITLATVPAVQVSLGNDTTICGDIHLLAQQPFEEYLWNTGSIATSIIATAPGTYWVETTDGNGCTSRDTITLSGLSNAALNLGPNTAICNLNPITLHAGPGFDNYEWQDGSADSTFTATTPGTYWVSVSDGCGTATDTITIGEGQINFELMLNNDTVACKTALPFALNAPGGYSGYLWQNGNASQSINVTAVGTYWLQVTDNNGCTGIDTFRVIDCVGIEENMVNPIRFYPNPATNYLRIELTGNTPVMVSLIDAVGRVVLNQNITGTTVINTQNFAAGLYMVQANAGNHVWRQKLIVLN
ncbi:MAG: T9SS type A sorting domain-containing protein [Sphingobacteriales bacterium JAD_PAG50586_3]|nr:MAG: T9SS type A sorting domain-containing protein [Sphingobacteriales bacterium JAD_PAG50586_3]